MYPNLEVEQECFGHTDEYVAGVLGITEQAYSSRKKSQKIRLSEARILAAVYNRDVDYLFEEV